MKYEAFLDWLPKQNPRIHAIVRVFEVPPNGYKGWCEDGMPDQDWVWACDAQVEPKQVYIRAARNRPTKGTLRALLSLSRKYSPVIEWERRKKGRCVPRKYELISGNSAGGNKHMYKIKVETTVYRQNSDGALVEDHGGSTWSKELTLQQLVAMNDELIQLQASWNKALLKSETPASE